jgi:transcriptional regulator with XRE-family HTH domain
VHECPEIVKQAAAVLRTARQASGYSQRALAARADTDQAAIARYEAGLVVPDLRTLDRLLAACGRELLLDTRPAPVVRRTGTRKKR